MGVTICDVGPRDGLQNEDVVLPVGVRAELVNRLAGAGLRRVEAVSFVNPKAVPAMADPEDVVAALAPAPETVFAGLALNERGYDRLRQTSLARVHTFFAASETFNRRNQNAGTEESVSAAAAIVERAHADGLTACVVIGTAFGCPFEGAVDPGWVLELAGRAHAAGADEVLFADTIGVGVPRQARALVEGGLALGATVGLHLHNTRNTGYANALAGLEAGATVLDASVGGLGGCPFAPNATGNIATEDLVYLLEGEGVDTGIDLDALIDVANWLEGVMGKDLPGQVHRAGSFAPVIDA